LISFNSAKSQLRVVFTHRARQSSAPLTDFHQRLSRLVFYLRVSPLKQAVVCRSFADTAGDEEVVLHYRQEATAIALLRGLSVPGTVDTLLSL
jgi:hypothetical protein